MQKLIIIFFILAAIGSSVSADEDYMVWVQGQNIPNEFNNVFLSSGLSEKYDVNFKLNPFYLRGDFNGDGKNDIAVYIKDKNSHKTGIAILHHNEKTIIILGAGDKTFEKGFEDFGWMGIWHIYNKKVEMGADQTTPPLLKGEAILAEKPESASGLIYWDGDKYRWYQQGD